MRWERSRPSTTTGTLRTVERSDGDKSGEVESVTYCEYYHNCTVFDVLSRATRRSLLRLGGRRRAASFADRIAECRVPLGAHDLDF